MKVHFACSTSELDTYKNNYLKICDLIRSMGHTITRDWVAEAIDLVKSKAVETLDREDIYSKVVASILASDVIVIEGTVSSFSVGHQVTLGLSKNKPTLFLIAKENGSKKNKQIKNSFLAGLNSPLLKIVEYGPSELPDILNDFFNNNGNRPVVKFNIILTKEIENYLNWMSFTHKINRSEFIRGLILKHISNDDKEYRKYLERK